MPTIVHAIPPPDTPSNHQPITAFDRSGAKHPVMFREPRTERPPAKMKDIGQSDENVNTEELSNHFHMMSGLGCSFQFFSFSTPDYRTNVLSN